MFYENHFHIHVSQLNIVIDVSNNTIVLKVVMSMFHVEDL